MTKKKTQKILIPRGTINPHEDTLIEIPTDLKDQPIVVAKKHAESHEKSVLEETVSEKSNNNLLVTTQERSKIKIMKQRYEDDKTPFDPKFHSSASNLQESDDYMELFKASHTDNGYHVETKRGSSPEASVQVPNAVSSKISNESNNENVMKPRRSCLLNCDKSLQNKGVNPYKSTSNTSCQSQRDEGPATQEAATNLCGASKKSSDSPPSVSFKPSKRREFKQNSDKAVCLNSDCQTTISEKPRKPRKKCSEKCDLHSNRSSTRSIGNDSSEDLIVDKQEKLKQFYKCSNNDLDDVYIEQLKRQFDEAKRKLEDAVKLASKSLKQMGKRSYSGMSRNISGSICDSVPERDLSFLPVCGGKASYVVYVPAPIQSPCPLLKQDRSSYDRSSLSDPFRSSDIYDNIVTRKPTDESPRRSSARKDPDSPFPFLKSPPQTKKDTVTQTSLKKTVKQSKDAPVQFEEATLSDTSKCSAKCMGYSNKKSSGSIKFVKEPSCNPCDSESLVGETSTIFS